jgi:hypothetical protein
VCVCVCVCLSLLLHACVFVCACACGFVCGVGELGGEHMHVQYIYIYSSIYYTKRSKHVYAYLAHEAIKTSLSLSLSLSLCVCVCVCARARMHTTIYTQAQNTNAPFDTRIRSKRTTSSGYTHARINAITQIQYAPISNGETDVLRRFAKETLCVCVCVCECVCVCVCECVCVCVCV